MQNTIKLPFTEDQKTSFKKIINGISQQKELFLLKGYAGCGKTYLTVHLVNYLSKHFKICYTAYTHCAVETAKLEFPFDSCENPENIDFKSVHSLLGLKEVVRKHGVVTYGNFGYYDATPICAYDIIIIDECSMIPDILLTHREYRGLIDHLNDKSVKHMLFVGDDAQLPPPKKIHSPVFNLKFEVLCTLDTIVRQSADNPIIKFSMNIRKNLQNPLNFVNKVHTLTDEKMGVRWLNKNRLAVVASKLFMQGTAFDKNANFAKVIAWRNVTVNFMNDVIRKMRFETEQKYVVGDFVICNKTYEYTDEWNYKYQIKNSTEMVVTDVHPIHHFIVGIDFKFEGWILTLQDNDKNVYRCKVVDETKEEFILTRDHFLREANDKDDVDTWKKYHDFMNEFLWLSYNYAITTHKAQGRNYENVIVMFDDMKLNPRIEELNRLFYTGITRASKNLFLYTKTI